MPATPNSRLRTLGQPPEPDGLGLLRRELAAKTRRVEETLLNLDNLISPTDWLDAGDGFPGFGAWRWNRPGTRDQDRTHAPITYLNEEDWRQHVALARDLCQRNHLALGFRDHVANFIGPISVSFVLRGQSPGASASGPIDADGDGEPDVDPIVKEATQAWDEWRELAEWGEGEHDREAECRTRLIVEGECTLRFFTGDARSNGLPHVRHIEPELIRTPPGASTTDPWGWGIKCTDDDDECEEALWLCRPDNPDDGREVRSSEYVRAKANVDRTVKRGLSDFFSVAEHLRKVLGLLDNMGHVARLQSAIAWWEQYPTATEAQVRAMIQSGTDYSRPKAAPGAPTRTSDVQNYEPGSIIRTEAGRQVQPGPVATGVAGYAQVEALLLRGVGFRWGCPSYFSGDADASFASVLVTGSPFVRITEARQEKVKGFARAVARRVLEFCERTGRLPRGTTQRVRPIATARPVVIADEEKQARTFLALYQQKCADPIEFVRKRGGDPKVVAANILAWQKKFAPPDQPPSGAGPGGPFPSPPGSAGGDGSSPNAAPVGEARRVREDTDSNGKPQPTTPAGDGLKWELRPYHVNGQEHTRWTRVKADGSEVHEPDQSDTTTPPPGDKDPPADTFDSAAAGKELVAQKLLPSDAEIEKIRNDGAGTGGRDKANTPERRWERAIAVILGPGWKASERGNSADDVSGSITINGVTCRVVLDGKLSGANSFSYVQDAGAARNKLDEAAKQENTIVVFLVAHVIPKAHDGSAAADGVTMRIGVHPQTISWLNDDIKKAGESGPFSILTGAEYHALRTGDPTAIETLRNNVFEKLQNINLDNYNTAQGNAAGKQLEKTTDETNKMADTAKKLGVSEEEIGKTVALASAKLPEAVQIAQVGALVDKFSDDAIAKMERLLAAAKAKRQATQP